MNDTTSERGNKGEDNRTERRRRQKGRRWLAPWKDSADRPVIYHCVTRVVERRLALGSLEKEQFRTFMRMQENFSGCRVLAYCLMGNHVHMLLEVPPLAVGGLSDEELLGRLGAVCGEAEVAEVAKELREARKQVREGLADEELVTRTHGRYTHRMHDLGLFMKTLLQRFTRWFNTKHKRSGTLWEARFKSVLVEEGCAARTMAAYIDLNPVRAGMVADPADYRWSSYGEAMTGGSKGNGKKARAGLVRALMAHEDKALNPKHEILNGRKEVAGQWQRISREYRMLLLGEGGEKLHEAEADGPQRRQDVAIGKMLRSRIRYFTDGAAIGSRDFVDGVFRLSRDRFGEKRKDGARKLRGNAAAAAGALWSVRDLKTDIGIAAE